MANNRAISMFYELKDAKNGEILESNFNQKKFSFVSGLGLLIQKLEDEIIDLKPGEEKTIIVTPADGVGEYQQEGLQSVPKEEFAGIDLVVGMELFGESEDGKTSRVIVKDIGDEEVMVDFNHPYAGKTLEFKVKMLENREATQDEILRGDVEGEHVCACGNHEDKCCGGEGHHHHHHHHSEDGGCGCKH